MIPALEPEDERWALARNLTKQQHLRWTLIDSEDESSLFLHPL
ncbi:hypothetical protein P4S72_18880 [Vibrio sp. PP-XX7]